MLVYLSEPRAFRQSDRHSDEPVNLSGLKASRNANTDTDILKYTELLNEHFVYYILKRTEW
jgi:hypothetical protein